MALRALLVSFDDATLPHVYAHVDSEFSLQSQQKTVIVTNRRLHKQYRPTFLFLAQPLQKYFINKMFYIVKCYCLLSFRIKRFLYRLNILSNKCLSPKVCASTTDTDFAERESMDFSNSGCRAKKSCSRKTLFTFQYLSFLIPYRIR